jgi:hypothetical protein
LDEIRIARVEGDGLLVDGHARRRHLSKATRR